MKYEVIIEKGEYALIKRGVHMDEYAVVNGLDKVKENWAWTVYYIGFGKYSPFTESQALSYVLEVFRSKTETNYISWFRLEELATKFKDRISEDALEFALTDDDYKEFFLDECEMEPHELEFFGIEMEREESGYDV